MSATASNRCALHCRALPVRRRFGAMDSWKRPYIAYFMFAAFLVVCGVVIR